jgi:hypothetical protein
MAISKNGILITSLEDWGSRAGPKSPNQWVDDRSAKEIARAWLEGEGERLPPEVSSAIATHRAFDSIHSWHAEPEVKLPFDKFVGETRNSDLVVHATDSKGPFLIAVEAKADERFGETVANTLAAAVAGYQKNSRSNGVTRINQLVKAILGARSGNESAVRGIRYQLLTASAGTLCEAERFGYSRAILLVHEFVTIKTSDSKHRHNAKDLNAFVKCVSQGVISSVETGKVYGPFVVPSTPLLSSQVGLYIGKVSRNLRPRSA